MDCLLPGFAPQAASHGELKAIEQGLRLGVSNSGPVKKLLRGYAEILTLATAYGFLLGFSPALELSFFFWFLYAVLSGYCLGRGLVGVRGGPRVLALGTGIALSLAGCWSVWLLQSGYGLELQEIARQGAGSRWLDHPTGRLRWAVWALETLGTLLCLLCLPEGFPSSRPERHLVESRRR